MNYFACEKIYKFSNIFNRIHSFRDDSDDADVNDSFMSKQDPLVEEVRRENNNFLMKISCHIQVVQSRLDRRLQEIQCELKRDKDQHGDIRALVNELQQQRQLVTPINTEEDKIVQARLLLAESNRQMVIYDECQDHHRVIVFSVQ